MYMGTRGYQALDEERVHSLALHIASGLQYLHGKNIVHRDIKPENILMSDMSDESIPIIGDFGYAKRLVSGQTCSRLCGTKGFMAPELLNQKEYSFPADVWSFGVVLYALVSSKLPYPVPACKLTKGNMSVFARLVNESRLKFESKPWLLISDELKDLLTRMLEKDPAKRITIDDVL